VSKLSPENQFPPTEASIRQILAQYGLPLTRYKPAKSGIENLTLIIWSDDHKYVLRVYRQHKKSDSDIRLELDFMKALHDEGLPLPVMLPSMVGDPLVIAKLHGQRWQSVLMNYAAGEHPKSYSPTLAVDMAKIQARMHVVGKGYARRHSLNSKQRGLKETHFTTALLSDTKTEPSLRPFLKRVQAFNVELDESLPIGLSHFDYDADNLFADNTGHVSAVLDFDDTQCMPLVVCLAYTLWDIVASTQQSDALVAQYLQAYQQIRPLSQSEKNILPAIILFRHYVIKVFNIHFGNFSQTDLDVALKQGNKIRQLVLRF